PRAVRTAIIDHQHVIFDIGAGDQNLVDRCDIGVEAGFFVEHGRDDADALRAHGLGSFAALSESASRATMRTLHRRAVPSRSSAARRSMNASRNIASGPPSGSFLDR